MVEQFGMSWRFTADAKVIDCTYQTFAEQFLPDAIDNHAGRQWIPGIGQPVAIVRFAPLESLENESMTRLAVRLVVYSSSRRGHTPRPAQ